MSTNSKAAEMLKFAQSLPVSNHDPYSFHNALFGIGGKFGEFFTTPAARKEFMQTDEYAKIKEMDKQIRARDNDQVNIYLRIPKETHELLERELSEYDDIKSLNDLMCLKLAAPVEAVV